jgi:hypothetical protein
MQGKIAKIKESRKKETKQSARHSKDLYVGRTLSIDELKKHSSPTLPLTPEFQSKGGMICL